MGTSLTAIDNVTIQKKLNSAVEKLYSHQDAGHVMNKNDDENKQSDDQSDT